MRTPSSLKREFLKKWMMGLEACRSTNQNMSILERKKAIKLTADIALASIRNGSTCWSQALIANIASRDNDDNKVLIKKIFSSAEADNGHHIPGGGGATLLKRVRSKKILKRSCSLQRIRSNKKRMAARSPVAKSIAKRMVKKRTQLLKSLVPGGQSMDDISLFEETLDYIVSLQAQVDVMRSLAKATELLNGK